MLSMNLGLKSLEKLIKGQKRPKKAKKGQKRPKRPTNAIQGHQRPKLQKALILSLVNLKSSIYWNEIIRKSDFLKVEIFTFTT